METVEIGMPRCLQYTLDTVGVVTMDINIKGSGRKVEVLMLIEPNYRVKGKFFYICILHLFLRIYAFSVYGSV